MTRGLPASRVLCFLSRPSEGLYALSLAFYVLYVLVFYLGSCLKQCNTDKKNDGRSNLKSI